MGGGEIVLIIFVALLFFGSKAIPDVARTMGKAMREFQKATNEIKREINESDGGIGDDISDIRSTIRNARNDIQDGIRKHTGDLGNDIQDIKSSITKETENITKPIYDQAQPENIAKPIQDETKSGIDYSI